MNLSFKKSILFVLLTLQISFFSFAQTELIPFRKGVLYGFSDVRKKIIIPCKYENVELFNKSFAVVKSNGLYGLIDKEGKEVLSCKYMKIENFGEAALVNSQDKYGFWNLKLQKIDFAYKSIEVFNDEFIIINKGEKYGLLDLTGKEILACIYSEIRILNSNVLSVHLDGNWGIYNPIQKRPIIFKYDYVHSFERGFARIVINEKYGLIDSQGKEVLPCKFTDWELSFNNGVGQAYINHRYVYVDSLGEEIVKLGRHPKNELIKHLIRNERLEIRNGKYGLVDSSGVEIIPCIYEKAQTSLQTRPLWFQLNGKWGVVDNNNKIIVPFIYEELTNINDVDEMFFFNGTSRVKLNGQWGLIDSIGNFLLPTKFDYIGVFREDLAFAQLKGDFGFVNKHGEEVIPFKYKEVKSFENGLALVSIGNSKVLINTSGKEITKIYSSIGEFENGRAVVSSYYWPNKFGVIDFTGKEIVECKYSKIEKFEHGYAKIKSLESGKWGLIDSLGREIIKCNYEWVINFKQNLALVSIGSDDYHKGYRIGYVDKEGIEYWEEPTSANNFFINLYNAELLMNEGTRYRLNNNFKLAYLYYDASLKKAQQEYKVVNANYIEFCKSIASAYLEEGEYQKTEMIYENLLLELKKYEKFEENYMEVCNLLSHVYNYQNQYSKAEPLNLHYLKYVEKFGKKSDIYISACNNMALTYNGQGNYQKAEYFYKEVLKLCEKNHGIVSEDYALFASNIGLFYRDLGDYKNALSYTLLAKAIYNGYDYSSHRSMEADFMRTNQSVASILSLQKDYINSLRLLLEVLEYKERTIGKDHINYSYTCNYLGLLYSAKYQPERISDSSVLKEADSYFRIALAIREKKLGKENEAYANTCYNLASLHYRAKNINQAGDYYQSLFKSLSGYININFIGLSESEKSLFLKKKNIYFTNLNSFYIQQSKVDINSSRKFFEVSNFTKGLLFYSGKQMKDKIIKSGDSILIGRYAGWKNEGRKLSAAYQLSAEQREKKNINLDSMKQVVEELEKELSRSTQHFDNSLLQPIKWNDVRDSLKQGELLIDISRNYIYKNGDVESKDSVYVYTFTYKSRADGPILIVNPNTVALETRSLLYYSNSIKFRIEDKLSYKAFWGGIDSTLKVNNLKFKKIFISLDGVYNQLNIATLLNPSTGKYLQEEYDLQIITAARDLLKEKKTVKRMKDTQLYLFGYPDYDLDDEKSIKKEDSKNIIPLASDTSQRFFSGDGKISVLPGTKKEIESIADIFKGRCTIKTYLGKEANESNLKKVNTADILHIATHGFFLSNVQPKGHEEEKGLMDKSRSVMLENPLLRSGILLAGAENTLKNKSVGSEDGILNAEEAMGLYLNSTSLVILSACETGLGTIVNGEGVYGLQRALRQAGAGSIMMSLWKVSDDATQKLMTSLYSNIANGQDKRTAFNNAVLNLKKEFPHPYYWGAFVMIGE